MTLPAPPGSSFWEREPALVVGQVQAILGILTTAGFAVSQNTTGTIVSAATIIAFLLGTYITRKNVTSPATTKAQGIAVSEMLHKSSDAVATAGAGNVATPCPAVPPVVEPVRDPATGWPLPEGTPVVSAAAPTTEAAQVTVTAEATTPAPASQSQMDPAP